MVLAPAAEAVAAAAIALFRAPGLTEAAKLTTAVLALDAEAAAAAVVTAATLMLAALAAAATAAAASPSFVSVGAAELEDLLLLEVAAVEVLPEPLEPLEPLPVDEPVLVEVPEVEPDEVLEPE